MIHTIIFSSNIFLVVIGPVDSGWYKSGSQKFVSPMYLEGLTAMEMLKISSAIVNLRNSASNYRSADIDTAIVSGAPMCAGVRGNVTTLTIRSVTKPTMPIFNDVSYQISALG